MGIADSADLQSVKVDKQIAYLKILIVVCSTCIVALGACVLFGWHTHNAGFIQIRPSYVPMQYNTSLAFLLCGLALACLIMGKPRIVYPCCMIVAIIAGLTLLQYLTAVDIGLDQLLMRHYITVKTSNPGRMAPNTAICFLIISTSLQLLAWLRDSRWLSFIAATSGSLLLAFSSVPFTGYLLGIETAFGWGALTRMAIHTALGFMTLSGAFLMLAWLYEKQHTSQPVNCLPIPIAIGVLTITVLLWQSLAISNDFNVGHEGMIVDMVFVFGVLLAIVLAWALNRAHAAQYQARETEIARKALELDVVERLHAETALKESEERFRSIFENVAIGIAQISMEGMYLQINEAFCRILGYTQQEVLTQHFTFQQITHPDDLKSDLQLVADLLESGGESFLMEKRYIRKDGGIAWVYLSVFLLKDAAGAPLYFISAAQDITERKALQIVIEQQARIDHLTGLHNRRHFMEEGELELARAVRYKSPLALMMLDADHFKKINDTYGHKAGDLVLQGLSRVCRETLREIDIIGRLGGEEFAILLPETDLQQAAEVAERLRYAINAMEIMMEKGLPLKCTVSIGVTALQSGQGNIDTLLHQADEALYIAKHAGRDQVRVFLG